MREVFPEGKRIEKGGRCSKALLDVRDLGTSLYPEFLSQLSEGDSQNRHTDLA